MSHSTLDDVTLYTVDWWHRQCLMFTCRSVVSVHCWYVTPGVRHVGWWRHPPGDRLFTLTTQQQPNKLQKRLLRHSNIIGNYVLIYNYNKVEQPQSTATVESWRHWLSRNAEWSRVTLPWRRSWVEWRHHLTRGSLTSVLLRLKPR